MPNNVFGKLFDDARPRHVAKLMENHDTHGWLIPALLREMPGLEGKAWRAVSLSIGVSARGASKLPDCGKRWPRSSWQMWRKNLTRKEMGVFLDFEGKRRIRFAVSCGPTISG